MSKNIRHQRCGRLTPGIEIPRGISNRLEGRPQCCIENIVALLAESPWLHAAAEQVEAKVEVFWIIGIIAKESHCCGPQPVGRSLCARNRAGYGLSETFERASKNFGVDRLLRLEVKVERSRGIAGTCGDRAQRRPLQAFGLKDRSRSIEDQLALQL